MYSVLIKVPEYRYPLYRSPGIRFKKVILKGFVWLLHVVDLQLVQLIAYCGVGRNGSWDVTNMRARARLRLSHSQLLYKFYGGRIFPVEGACGGGGSVHRDGHRRPARAPGRAAR